MNLDPKKEVQKKEAVSSNGERVGAKHDEGAETEMNENFGRSRKRRKKHFVRDVILLVATVVLIGVGYAALSWRGADRAGAGKIQEKTLAFLKENIPGAEVSITEFVREGDFYRVILKIGSETETAYVSLDGKNYLRQYDMDQSTNAEKAPPPVVEAAIKKEKPEVDLFVMSLCPFGLQAQKGILPVLAKLGNSIDFSMRYVSYIMHDKKEFDENIRQYCIEKEERAKYPGYLSCFTASALGDSAGCGKTAGISEAKNAACVAATDKKFALTEKFKASTGTYPPFGIDQELN